MNSVCLWIQYSVCKFYSAGKPPDLFKSHFQLPSTIKDITNLKQKSILSSECACASLEFLKSVLLAGMPSAGHQDVEILAISLVLFATETKGSWALPLASGQVSQHVQNLEQIGKEHFRAAPLTLVWALPGATAEWSLRAGCQIVPPAPCKSPKCWKSAGLIVL